MGEEICVGPGNRGPTQCDSCGALYYPTVEYHSCEEHRASEERKRKEMLEGFENYTKKKKSP